MTDFHPNTLGTLFSGGEGFGIGAQNAGLHLQWGIENNPDIAAVANDNLGNHITVADITTVNPSEFSRVEFLHASPPCPNFSLSKVGREEQAADIDLARATIYFIETLRPRVFTLENVWLYRRSESWELIRDGLSECGYIMDIAHINAADYGVPQNRKRMFVRAVNGGLVPHLPWKRRRKGWYQAIEDLIPSLEVVDLAPWQKSGLDSRVSKFLDGGTLGEQKGFLIGGQYKQPQRSKKRTAQAAASDEQAFTVTASYKGDWKAVTGEGIRKVTPRCLARFQTFPDWYRLPKTNRLASRIIGNAVPCLLAEKMLRQLKREE